MMHMMHTMFTMSVMHIMFRYGIDALLIAVLVLNVLIGRKSRRLVRKLQKYYDDRAPVLINAMEKMASAICPFCAAAAGLVSRLKGSAPSSSPSPSPHWSSQRSSQD